MIETFHNNNEIRMLIKNSTEQKIAKFKSISI